MKIGEFALAWRSVSYAACSMLYEPNEKIAQTLYIAGLIADAEDEQGVTVQPGRTEPKIYFKQSHEIWRVEKALDRVEDQIGFVLCMEKSRAYDVLAQSVRKDGDVSVSSKYL